TKLIAEGIKYKGFALIDVLQPCVSFNHFNTYTWYNERVYDVNKENGYDLTDKVMAFKKALEWGDRIPIGVIYRSKRVTYSEQIHAFKQGPLVKQDHDPLQVMNLFEEFIP
ncbi:MAG: 2-oxoacid ferredoxin oxidoreductase, partial [Candidatus Ranarchaeia archaeon]